LIVPAAANCRLQLQQALETRALELSYEKTCRQVEVICEAENARQIRIQALLLEDENDDLHAQLAQHDERIDEVERHNDQIQEDLEACQGNLESAQCDLRMRTRDIETMKVPSGSQF
jgi:chromosome segregation ATPase